MSATVDVSALKIETPVAHLSSPMAPISSKGSTSAEAVDIRPTYPTFRFGLLSGNGKRISYSSLRAGFPAAGGYHSAAKLARPLHDHGCSKDRTDGSSSIMANFLVSEDKTDSREYSECPQSVDKQKRGMLEQVCASVNVNNMSDVLNDGSKPAVGSRLLTQHLIQSSSLMNICTKNDNVCSPAAEGDKSANNCDNENIIETTVDDDNGEWSDKDDDDDDDDDDDEIECGECGKIFSSIQLYMDHTCCRLSEVSVASAADDGLQVCTAPNSFANGLPTNDSSRFLGKIIFTQNGSAYVIEDMSIDINVGNNLAELGNSITLGEDGSVLYTDACVPQLSSVILFPKMNSSLITPPNQNMMHQLAGQISTPPFYSFHVFDIGTVQSMDILQLLSPALGYQLSPQPIVMCFICRIIFRTSESFFRHTMLTHSVEVTEDKRSVISRFNNCIICHACGEDKQPKFSVLFPMDDSCVESRGQDIASVSCRRKLANFVVSRRSSDCERRKSFCDDRDNSFTSANNVSKILQENILQANVTAGCNWKSNLCCPIQSSSLFAAKHKITKENCLRVSSPVPATMTGWYALPSIDIPENIASTDSCAVSETLSSPSATLTSSASRSSPNSIVRSSAATSTTSSLPMPSLSLGLSTTANNQTDDVFSPATTFSTSAGLHLPSFSCTCEEHSPERLESEECLKYDVALDPALYLGHHSSLTHSRNSCKTLKCPKCNWHYKYQETLDIHMKEKHPDNDAQCVYCLTNQSHPRLTRGESYSCGYKPYRCEVCNYSTTTKGNLSIHMQSDKHINNMQELVSGSSGRKMQPQHPLSSEPASATSTAGVHNSSMALSTNDTLSKMFKQKQTFRCDICNYETSLARNLRIHMTSEKHAHNLFVMRQGISHLSHDGTLSQANSLLTLSHQELAAELSAFRQHVPNLVFNYDKTSLIESATPGCPLASQETSTCSAQEKESSSSKRPLSGKDAAEMFTLCNRPLSDKDEVEVFTSCNIPLSDKDAAEMFSCCICNNYASDQLEDVLKHIHNDRTTARSSCYNTSFNSGDHYCHLCSYKTHLKANFHLHCQTDKHLHKLQTFNHILEGGSGNEWKLSCPDFPWQICCNPCGFYANSKHNIQLHVSNSEHEARGHIFKHLQVLQKTAPASVAGGPCYYHCSLCAVNVRTKQQLIAHSRTPHHTHMEEPRPQTQGPDFDVYLLKEMKAGEDVHFLPEGDENNVSRTDNTDTTSVVGNSSSNSITGLASIATPAAPSAAHCSTATESRSPECSFSDKSALLSGALALAVSGDDLTQTIDDGAKYETTMKTVDVSLSSTLTTGNPAASVKADISATSSTSFRSCTNATESDGCSCGRSGHLDCYCSPRPSPSRTPSLPEEEGRISGCALCPLCRRNCRDVVMLENHLAKEHNVTKEGMQRLVSMVIVPSSTSSSSSSVLIPTAITPLHADSNQRSPSLSSLPLTIDPSIPKNALVNHTRSLVQVNHMTPSFVEVLVANPEQSTPRKTDPPADSVVDGTQDRPHSASSSSTSTASSPHVTSSPTPETTSPTAISATISEATPSLSNQEEFKEIDLQLVEAEHTSLLAKEGVDLALQERLDREFEDLFNCQTCSKPFSDIDRLYDHQNELGHLQLKQTPQGPGYLCWQKGCSQYFKTALTLQIHFREIHAKRSLALSSQELELYTFSCDQCSFSFKSLEALKKHTFIHLILSVTQCRLCSRRFSCKSNMKRHLETGHADLSVADVSLQMESFNKNIQILFTAPTYEQFTSKVLLANGNVNSKVLSLMNQEKVQEREMMMIDDFDMKSNVTICTNYMDTSESLLENCGEKRFIERGMNNQSLTEENYRSKDCKYKCDVCKLGYTHQNDLLAHVKTSLHQCNERKASANAKVEAYKCDITVEPFKQESDFRQHCSSAGHQIKLQHQNRVSGDNLRLISSIAATPSSRVSSPFAVAYTNGRSEASAMVYTNGRSEASAMAYANGRSEASAMVYTNASNEAILDTSTKPYKCNVCQVSYTNQSGFEIHLRSVGHRTRANKLGELILSGLVNESQTLLEHPDSKIAGRLQAQIIADMIHQQVTAQAVPSTEASYFNLQSLQGINAMTQLSLLGLLPTSSHALLSTPAQNSLMAVSNTQMEACLSSFTGPFVKTGGMLDNTGMSASANRQQFGEISWVPDPTEITAHGEGSRTEASSSGSKVTADVTDTRSSTDAKMSRKNSELPPQFHAPVIARARGFMGRFKPQLYKSLLENFGFEFVMHFNEEHTRTTQARDVNEEYLGAQNEYSEELTINIESNTDFTIKMNGLTENGEMGKAFHGNTNDIDMDTSESRKEVELTELSRQQCRTCRKYFSNLWVLKNHEEEIHNYFVSSETIENFGQRFKEEWENNLPKFLELESTSLVQSPQNPLIPATPQAAEKLFPTADSQQSKPAVPPQLPCHFEVPQLLPFMSMNLLPMHFSMNLMNLGLQNSLMSSVMMQNMDLSQSFLAHIPPPSLMDSSLPMSSQQQLHASAAAAAAAAAQKRVRTRISDDQLKVLRQYFDINNSPTEEQVNTMSEQTGLPQKVIKHWFRNTLFKERQRNKDSPYNFNNPPCTSIDLGEYDRTGKIPEIKLEVDDDYDRQPTPALVVKKETPPLIEESIDDKNECDTELIENAILKMDLTPKMELYIEERKDQESHSGASSPSISSVPSTPAVSAPPTPTPAATGNTMNTTNPLAYSLDSFAVNMARLEAATFHNMGKRANRTRFTDYQIKTLQDYFEQNAYPKDDELEHLSKILGLSARVIVVWFQNARQKARKVYENHPVNEAVKDLPSSYPRTSVPNYQCKRCNSVFQRYYELSKHQKHFCVAENNNNKPIPSMAENDSSFSFSNDDSFLSDYQPTPLSANKTRDTQNPSYPPEQRCVSNTTTCVIPTVSTPPSSASSSSFFIPSFTCDKCSMTFSRFDTWQEHQRAHSIAPAMFTPLSTSPAFRMLETLAGHESNKPVAAATTVPTPSSILPSMASTPNASSSSPSSSHEPPAMTLTPTSPSSLSPSSKRKTDSEEDESGEQPKDKRLRTTILPEQLDYLYQQYQVDCNPSRKQLEHIASTVNLKKRVVQVWFQNTRARERKGHYRAHQQLINKRCPFCRALFRAKSALESHLATKHPEQVSKGDINIDLLPDAVTEPGQVHTSLPSYFSHASSPLSSLHMVAPDMKFLSSGSAAALPNYMALMSASNGINLPFPGPGTDIMGNSSFEDPFFQKYMKDLTKAVSTRQEHSLLHSYNHLVTPEAATVHSTAKSYSQATPTDFSTPSRPLDAHNSKITPQPSAFSSNDDAPLDLSKPIKTTETVRNDPAPYMSQSANLDYGDRQVERDFFQRQYNLDDSFSETQSEMADHEYTNDVMNSPPSPSNMTSSFMFNAGSGGSIGKRYRTQMSAVQVRVMKYLFQEYKTPTMVECEFLGQEIGLPKRVVQVWFQNARAKEKKAKLTSGKSTSPESDFSKPLEQCQLCRCKYTHKLTLQDHIFTKAHIEKIKAFLNSQGDLDNDLSSSSFPGVFQSHNEADHMGKRWDSSVSSMQNAQLQSLCANPAAMSYAVSQGDRSQKSHEKESPKKEKKIEDTMSRNEQKQKQAVLEMAMNAQMFSALGGYMPGLDSTYLPYMYSGVPGYFPGIGLPLIQPGLIPEHMVAYDRLPFGTPLGLLQIPSAAIKSVSEKVKEAGSVLAQYTQDCQALADLHSVVSAADLQAAAEATIDVGYICKKCHVVYPAKESCVAHQRSFCLTNTSSLPKGFEPIMKLEQIQYECRACNDRFSTILEFKSHCQQESHKQKFMKFKMKEAARREAAESPSSSAPYASSTSKINLSSSPYLSKPQPASPLFNNNSISHNKNQVTSPDVPRGMKLPLHPSPAHQYNKVSLPVSAAFIDKHTAAFGEIPDIHRVKAE